MAPIPETIELTANGREWMAAALGAVLTVCVSLSIALVVVLCGGGKPAEEKPKEDAPAPAGEEAPAGDAPPAEEGKQPSAKEPPGVALGRYLKMPTGKGSAKEAPSKTTGASAKGPELKLTSDKAASKIGGKSAKGGIDLKKQPSLQLQAATAKK